MFVEGGRLCHGTMASPSLASATTRHDLTISTDVIHRLLMIIVNKTCTCLLSQFHGVVHLM